MPSASAMLCRQRQSRVPIQRRDAATPGQCPGTAPADGYANVPVHGLATLCIFDDIDGPVECRLPGSAKPGMEMLSPSASRTALKAASALFLPGMPNRGLPVVPAPVHMAFGFAHASGMQGMPPAIAAGLPPAMAGGHPRARSALAGHGVVATAGAGHVASGAALALPATGRWRWALPALRR